MFALSYPALNGEVVTEGHAKYCNENGHATHTVDNINTNICPRCGETKTAPARPNTKTVKASEITRGDFVLFGGGKFVEVTGAARNFNGTYGLNFRNIDQTRNYPADKTLKVWTE